MRTLQEAAERIVRNYEEVCQGMPPGNTPESSTDNAVRLAVHYLKNVMVAGNVCEDLLRAYNQKDDVLFDRALSGVGNMFKSP